jgi:hypothetical protein
VHYDGQGDQEMLQDKEKKRGKARGEEWHEGRHVHGMVMNLISPGFNHQQLVLGLMQEMQRNHNELKAKEV